MDNFGKYCFIIIIVSVSKIEDLRKSNKNCQTCFPLKVNFKGWFSDDFSIEILYN